MALMQKHEKDVGIAGVNDLNQWPVSMGSVEAADKNPKASESTGH
jgi:hypothetical protein